MSYTPGWIDDPEAVQEVVESQPFASFGDTPANEITDLPDKAYLWDFAKQVTSSLLPARHQGSIGSCVSFGTARAVEYTMLAEIAHGDSEEYKTLAEEVIYGGSRVEIGRGRLKGDGSIGAWAAEFVKQYGVVSRGVYPGHDLREYSEETCRKFGNDGVPEDLEVIAKVHSITTITKVLDWDQAKKALAQGYGISVSSNYGFERERNKNGVCAPRGTWRHCMCLSGYTTINGIEYGRIDNSWGPTYFSGPLGPGDPGPEGFYAVSSVVDKMLKQGDSWAFSAFDGFTLKKLDWVV